MMAAVLDVGARADADEVAVSPRTRQWNQMPVSEPITTSPITAAVGAMKASGAIFGVTPSSVEHRPHAGDRLRLCRAFAQACAISRAPTPVCSPSIRPMFCTAAPEAPLPRLSSRATSTAWRCVSLA